jgi:hypothetical protein
MSLPNSLALHSTHSRHGSRGGRPGGGLGSRLSGSVGTRHSPHLCKHSAGVASAATTQQGRGAGAVSPMAMAYSTPAQSLTFSKALATSQGHLVSSLSQSQSTSAARKEGDARPLKGNVATKKRGKSDTDDGSPQKGNTAKKKRGKLDAGHKAAGKRTASTDTMDNAGDDNKEEGRGRGDAWDEAEYDDEDDVLPVTDAPFGVTQRDVRHLAEFNTAAAVVAHWLEFMQRAFPPQPTNAGKVKTQGAAAASIKACRPQSEVDYIVYVLMNWQVGVRLTELNPGTERDRL